MRHAPASSLSESLRRAVAQAVLAPSPHNSQPWRFVVRDTSIDLRADRGRALTVVDPDGRELTMSCGAALFQLRTALRAAALDASVERLPDPTDRDLLARVEVRPGALPTEDERALAEAIPWRHTVRAPYLGVELPEDFIARARQDAESEGAWLIALSEDSARVALSALVVEAHHRQWSDPRFRRELASWMRPDASDARDGLFGLGDGTGVGEHRLDPPTTRLLDAGPNGGARDLDLARVSPLLAILGTDGDSPAHWLRAGEALDRVLLRAESEDVAASFLNQPVEVPTLRRWVGDLAGRGGFPQAILRMGFGPDGRETRRRAVADVIA